MNNLPFKPVGTQLLLEEIEVDEKTEGGIILPDKVRKPVNQGIIVAVGEQVPHPSKISIEENPFAIGHHVVFPLYSDSAIETRVPDPKHEGRTKAKRFLIVDYTQVLLSDFGYYGKQ